MRLFSLAALLCVSLCCLSRIYSLLDLCMVSYRRVRPLIVTGMVLQAHGDDVTPVIAQKYGPNDFGDIMGDRETYTKIPLSFTPIERIILTANGNLQRILSAYYGKPITIVIKKCDLVQESLDSTLFDREVDLTMDGQVVCTATGKIWIYSERCIAAVREQRVGVGQLFRYFQVLPTFTLLAVGKLPTTTPAAESICLWREYELTCPDMHCRFLEKFAAGFLDFGSALNKKDTIIEEHEQIGTSFSNCSSKDCKELP